MTTQLPTKLSSETLLSSEKSAAVHTRRSCRLVTELVLDVSEANRDIDLESTSELSPNSDPQSRSDIQSKLCALCG